VNGDVFFDFVRGSLIPEMRPFDGCNPMSIAVMDNCSIHHTEEVADLFLQLEYYSFFYHLIALT
jgi:hypothetical protein